MVKNVFAMLKYNQYKSYKKPTTKKATTIFPVKLRQRYA